MKFKNLTFRYFLIVAICLAWFSSDAQILTDKQIDSLANKAITTFNVPGMAVTIVKNGKVVLAKGYGIRSVLTKQKVDENTLFGIASNSKAFTAAALGILVNDGKLKWDDKVMDYIPDFRMYDPFANSEFTIRDLLTHRSGLGPGAGDLMHNPDSTTFTINEIIHNLRYLKPVASFRSKYAYDNILYIVAGELIARISGMSWDDFIEKRIMLPLQMVNSGAGYVRVKKNSDIIDGHREVNGKLETIVRSDEELDAGAGGIYSSAADMGKWMLMQLNNGKYGAGLNQQLFSEKIHQEMWTPQINIPVGKSGGYDTHFGAYGLGWFLIDAKGKLEVFHTGQDDGMISEVTLLPELNFGITVLTNQEGGAAVRAVVDQVVDGYLGLKGIDRIQAWANRVKKNNLTADTVTQKVWQQVDINQKKQKNDIDTNAYTGTYHDNWFGDVNIYGNKGKLFFRSKKSPQLRGEMFSYKANAFVVKWDNPQIKAEAFALFNVDENGKAIEMTMKTISEQNSGGFDFQDLDFKKVN